MCSIRSCCCGNCPTYKGYIWKYEKQDRKHQNKIEVDLNDYVNIGIIKEKDYSKYAINKDGSKIIHIKSQKELTFFKADSGYNYVYLCPLTNNKKADGLLVHKIINQVLNGGEYEEIVDHVNGKKDDNSIDNLEAVTQKENMIRALGRSVKKINAKTGETIEVFRTIKEAYESLNMKSGKHISQVCNGKGKTSGGFNWEWA